METQSNKISVSNGNCTKNQTSTEYMEMISLHPTCYISLRDIIATTSSATTGLATPPMPESPSSRKSSWDDIPIKNPLVKHAALAYLQPMSTPEEIDNRSWIERTREILRRCCFTADREDDDVEVGCLGLLNGVVWLPIKKALGKILSRRDHHHQHQD
ncbi:hypothetical protein V2J09_015564 [Rumex salicifolius]